MKLANNTWILIFFTFNFANKQNFAKKTIQFSSPSSPSSCLPSSTHSFCYVPFSPPPSSYTHFFFYFFSFSFFLHPLFFHILSFLPTFFSIHGFFASEVLLFGCILVCFSLTTLYAMLQMLLFFVFFFSMCVTNYNVLFQCNFIL